MNPIPPQAYTRDVLVKAIEWMQTQPPAIREKATSADLLVSFFMNACRKGSGSTQGSRFEPGFLDAPVSTETFKADLKHLAEGLKQFEDPIAPPPQQPGRFPSYGIAERQESQKVEPLFPHAEPPYQAPAQHYAPVFTPPAYTPPPPPPAYNPPPSPPPPRAQAGFQWTVDARSLAAARELQQRLNLSNEGETLRMLIALGMERARDLFP